MEKVMAIEQEVEIDTRPWNTILKEEIDELMEEKRSARDKTRAACYLVQNRLEANGKLQRGHYHKGEIVNLVGSNREWDIWFTGKATGKTFPIGAVLLNLGVIPTDPLYKAIPAYLEKVIKVSEKRVDDWD
jgi:hypothetical protein